MSLLKMKWSGNERLIKLSLNTVTIGGRKYKTVKIGNQIWTAENLDWKFDGLDIGNSGISDSYPKANYYSNDEATYGQDGLKYGLLYNYWAAIEINSMLNNGWRVPSQVDWETLFNYVSSYGNVPNILKSQTGWYADYNGIDEFGFNAKPSGGWYHSGSEFIGTIGIYSSSTKVSDSKYYRPFIQCDMSSVNIHNGQSGYEYWYTWYQVAIRLVKDA